MKYYQLHTQTKGSDISIDQEEDIISHSEKFRNILSFSKRVATSSSTILIQGESGTGKGVLANYIHNVSHRKNESFLTINCAAIPEELLESELFGYVKGAFTGANPSGKMGLLETANNGTVFLDEIGDISLSLQAKLLPAIQDKEFIPVGGNKKRKVNIRIIAATNRDLSKLVESGEFREDLYYRLHVIDITIPPLRERKEDIAPLTHHLLQKFNQEYETNKIISDECLNVLSDYSWPGNIRQLESLIERLVITSDTIIDVADLPETFHHNNQLNSQFKEPKTMDEAIDTTRKHMIRKSFKKYKSTRKVVEDLQVSQTTASRLIRKYCSDFR